LFIFYFLLNEEVRKYIKEKKKRDRHRLKERTTNSFSNIQDMIKRNERNGEEEEEDDEDEEENEEEEEDNEDYVNDLEEEEEDEEEQNKENDEDLEDGEEENEESEDERASAKQSEYASNAKIEAKSKKLPRRPSKRSFNKLRQGGDFLLNSFSQLNKNIVCS
jgi:hypothetical protein